MGIWQYGPTGAVVVVDAILGYPSSPIVTKLLKVAQHLGLRLCTRRKVDVTSQREPRLQVMNILTYQVYIVDANPLDLFRGEESVVAFLRTYIRNMRQFGRRVLEERCSKAEAEKSFEAWGVEIKRDILMLLSGRAHFLTAHPDIEFACVVDNLFERIRELPIERRREFCHRLKEHADQILIVECAD